MELWRLADEGRYEVSSEGRVRRNTPAGHGTYPGRVLKPALKTSKNSGYLQVVVGPKENRKWRYVHALVAEAFIGPRPSGMQVNHKDGNTQNNKASNLEYLTQAQNAQHAKDLGLIPHGVTHYRYRQVAV